MSNDLWKCHGIEWESTQTCIVCDAVKAKQERIIKLLEAQEVEGWFDRGLKQHFIVLIKGEGENQEDNESVSLLTQGENK